MTIEEMSKTYYLVHGVAYGYYDSEFAELESALFELNDNGNPRDSLRLEHFEGTDVEEYCPSDEVDVSGYNVASCFNGTVSAVSYNLIRSYDGEGGIRIEVVASKFTELG